MQSRRCFLAGDAAHVHSPATGQGLNTGVQDASNLAWKLASVVRGETDRQILDTYSAERVPVAAALLNSTRIATQMVELRSATVDQYLPAVFEVANAWPPMFHALNRGRWPGSRPFRSTGRPPISSGSRRRMDAGPPRRLPVHPRPRPGPARTRLQSAAAVIGKP
jgi:NADPH-dependent dioxygenase